MVLPFNETEREVDFNFRAERKGFSVVSINCFSRGDLNVISGVCVFYFGIRFFMLGSFG